MPSALKDRLRKLIYEGKYSAEKGKYAVALAMLRLYPRSDNLDFHWQICSLD